MNLDQKVTQITERLQRADVAYGHGVDDAQDEAIWIVYTCMGIAPPIQTDSDGQDDHGLFWQLAVSKQQEMEIDRLVKQRIEQRIPFAYLLNQAWFAGYSFYVDERVIIPRSYLSEWIPDRFEPWIDANSVNSILDLCTGSGCIAISCAMEFGQAEVTASDISAEALQVVKINIDRYGLQHRVHINQGDGFQGLTGQYDLILCNPPYVSDDRMQRLPQEYLSEPGVAFKGGEQGLDFIVPMLKQARKYLCESGSLIVEAGSASFALEQRFANIPFTWLSTAFDEQVVFLFTAEELDKYQPYFDD